MHRDHIIPASRGGRDDAHNCIVACAACNLGKSDFTPSEWKATGLPDWVYVLEAKLVQRYRMPPRKRRGTNSAQSDLVCWFCSKGFKKFGDVFLEFVDACDPGDDRVASMPMLLGADGALKPAVAWPGNGPSLLGDGPKGWPRFIRRAHWVHADCGAPDVGYWIPSDRVFEETPKDAELDDDDYLPGWEWHLRNKDWWWPGINVALTRTREFLRQRFPNESRKHDR